MAHCGQRVFRIHKYTLNSCTVISVLSILCFTCCMSTEQHSYEWKLDDMVSNCRPWVSVQAKTDNGTDLHNITLTQSNSALFNNRVLIHTARSNFTARSRAPCLYQGSDLRTGESVYASELRGRLKMTFSYNGEWYRAVSLRNSSEPVVAKRFEIREDIFSTCHYKIPQESWSELKLGDLRVDSSPASSLVRRKRSLNLVSSHDVAVKKVMELALVIDRSFVNKTGSEDNAVARAMQLSNYANGVYQRLNLSLVLTNIIIWSSDVIDVTADPDETLNKFTVYKAMQAEFKHDTIVLMSNVKWNRTSSNVIGLAWIKGLCGRLFSSAIVSDAYSSVVNTEWVLAHEIGHNLGFLHVEDIIGCTCKNTGRCIMNAYAPAAYLQRVLDWSNCTVDEWRTQMSETWRSCLADAPDTSYQTSSSPLCGNGILETGEQCDCGPVETCKSQCCNASTCRLKEGATCASGPCCDWTNCSFRARGDVCRSASGPCDVPETCSGSSEWCPADDKLADGVDCASGQVRLDCFR